MRRGMFVVLGILATACGGETEEAETVDIEPEIPRRTDAQLTASLSACVHHDLQRQALAEVEIARNASVATADVAMRADAAFQETRRRTLGRRSDEAIEAIGRAAGASVDADESAAAARATFADAEAFAEFLGPYVASAAYADSALNHQAVSSDSLRYATIAQAREAEARAGAGVHPAFGARFARLFADAMAQLPASCQRFE